MLFVVDENSWCLLEGRLLDYEETIERILDCIDDLVIRGHACCYSDDLFHMDVIGSRKFYELYSDDGPIQLSRELQNRVAVIFGRLNTWQELDRPWPDQFDAAICDRDRVWAPSICWAHAQSMRGPAHAVPCIVDPQRYPCGPLAVDVDHNTTEVWFISSLQESRLFIRWLILKTTSTPEELSNLFNMAFPTLDAVEGCFSGIKAMSKPYASLVPLLVHHLSVLADHGNRIFSGAWQHAPNEFGALGVDVSDENGNTKKNSKARQARTKTFRGKDYIFWWHTKIERDRDRIHFYPDDVSAGGRIIVGVFAEHLVT